MPKKANEKLMKIIAAARKMSEERAAHGIAHVDHEDYHDSYCVIVD